MFDSLSERLGSIFERLRGRGALEEKDVAEALREVRVALLEADVALPVAKDFIARVKERAIGQEVLRSVAPGQQVVKIVHDALVETLGGAGQDAALDLAMAPPAPILMVGLQGSGKTTTTAKLALRLEKREKKRVLMASLDVRRPAAQEQLRILGEQAGVKTLPVVAGQTPLDIARRALEAARLSGFDVVLLDTAGRLSIDEQLMAEVADIHALARPIETLLVVDALTGQDAVNTAEKFKARLPVTGVILTRMDGDARGGAALSMRAVTGAPVKFVGVGEKLDALDAFDAKRMAGRILGMGDIVSLVEKAAEDLDLEKARRQAKKLAKGAFDLDDLAEQFRQMRKMGGMGAILGLMPGMGKMKKMVDAAGGFDDREIKRQEAIISSMTKAERRKPAILNARRKIRIAKGSGTSVQEVNKLLKAHRQMADMMKKMGKGGMKGLAGQMMGMGGLGGALGGTPGVGDPGALLKQAGGGEAQGSDEIDFDALEKALSGRGPMPPGLGGPPGRKK
ncbi:signal recognition particle protein [Amphiplicatus metriothermophilus]|uniref:Signal recognition particle protein n=1 Tax=Amphiplicatus metriothermophilus TaxID=1519374 RepID=A0A239PJD4_9PROT|nr:signal recognition particle protein [Amphiplicatus metriothermophilus]MBB5517754.1 signal recognition particle subunit SRP54 [Amphiplicatus metriothermophilus]SNT67912.1 signal recognition particle subunit FFH/SRP54 (srp54) [Amphiplicatus metriothermophilus]